MKARFLTLAVLWSVIPPIALALSLDCSSAQAALGLKKKWYEDRARSNLEIGNYKAAIEAYEKVLEEDPNDSAAMKSLGLAYEKQGLKDKAIEEYDRYLEKNPDDSEVAFKQAQALEWSRYSYRRKDALKYYEMGLKKNPNTRMRLRYARLLAANHSTNAEAIEQYRAVLRKEPNNAEAHLGLARAYAWDGHNDQAVYEKALAREYGATSTADLRRLDRDLGKGRETLLGGEFLFLSQPAVGSDINGFQLGAMARAELGAFVTGQVHGGVEDYWSSAGSAAQGGYLSLGTQIRMDEEEALNLALGYHGISPQATLSSRGGLGAASGATGADRLVGKGEYRALFSSGFEVAPGFERSMRRDSFLSYVGSASSGAARANQFQVDLAWKGERAALELKPYFGWVTSLSASPNLYAGIDGEVNGDLFQAGRFLLQAINLLQIQHYGEDQSAQSGVGAAGYFSPQLFLNESPSLKARIDFSDRVDAEVAAGPAVQLVNDTLWSSAWLLGANLSAGFQARLARHLSWKAGGSFLQVANQFNQLQVDQQFTYTF